MNETPISSPVNHNGIQFDRGEEQRGVEEREERRKEGRGGEGGEEK